MRFIAALMLCVCACDGCNDDTLASVTQTVGQVDRDRADRAHVWSDAAVGDELELGDGIRTGTSATARLSLTRGGSLEVRPQTILRFGAGAAGDGSYSLSLGMGEIVVETEEGGTTHSFLGALVLEAGSRVRLTADGDLEVILGALDLQLSNGESLALGEGESYGAEGAGEKVLAEPIDLATESGAPADWTVRTAVRAQTRVTESGTWGDVAQEAPLVAGAAIRARSRGSFAIAASSVVEGEARARLRILEAERGSAPELGHLPFAPIESRSSWRARAAHSESRRGRCSSSTPTPAGVSSSRAPQNGSTTASCMSWGSPANSASRHSTGQ